MTTGDSGYGTLLTVLAVLLAVPPLVMVVAMPLVALTGVGHAPFGSAGLRLLMPLVPLTVLGTVWYVVYAAAGDDRGRRTDRELGELRVAYARGELSDAEFERRRDRLETRSETALREVSTDE
jgi:putative membrane protein